MEYIYEAHDIVPRALCKKIIEKFENDPDKSVGKIGGGEVIETFKKTTDLKVYTKPEWKMINDQIQLHLVSGIKKYFEYLANIKVANKLVKEKIIKYVKLNSSCIYLLYFFTINIPDIIVTSETRTFQVICSSNICAPKMTPNIGIR